MTSLAALATLSLFLDLAVSQVSYPPCTVNSMIWSYNSFGQNPCGVAAYLQSTCSQGIFTVPALPLGYEYSGPAGGDNNDLCKCNTVTYALLSACDACQGAQWISWLEWVTNCTKVLDPSTFPNQVPYGTSVPQWALLDVTLENNWDLNAAMDTGDLPEIGPGTLIGSTTTSTPSSTPRPTGPTTTASPTASRSADPLSSSSPVAASASQKSSSHTAVIVGGAVAAVAIIAIFVLGIFYLRRRRNTKPPYAPFSVSTLPTAQSVPAVIDGASAPQSGARNARSEAATIASSARQESAPMGVYNPNNAATLPEVQDPDAPHFSVHALYGQHQGSGNNHAHMHVSRPEDLGSLSST